MANQAAKPKVSPVVVGAGILGIAGVAYFLMPQDAPVPVKKVTMTRSAAQTAVSPDGITDADLKVKFEPYVSPKRDAFMPLVQSTGGIHAGGPNNVPGGRGTWLLTGVSDIDGHLTALIENSSAGQSQFLKTGDLWSGLRVINVSEDTVTFQNAKGQKTELMFPASDGKVAVKGDDAATFGGEPPGETPTPAPATGGGAPPVIILQGGGGQNNGGGDNGGGGGFPGGGGGFPGGGGGGFPGGGGGGFPGGGGGFPGGGGGGFPGGGGGFPGQGTFNNTIKSATVLASNTWTAENKLGKATQK